MTSDWERLYRALDAAVVERLSGGASVVDELHRRLENGAT
jgi:hypothetical protein